MPLITTDSSGDIEKQLRCHPHRGSIDGAFQSSLCPYGTIRPSFFELTQLGRLGGDSVFIISGYLVTASWYHDPSLVRFSLRRILRIWPALTVVVIATAYGLGAWVAQLPLMEYWSHRATLDYLMTLAMRLHFVLPGVFTNNPYPSASMVHCGLFHLRCAAMWCWPWPVFGLMRSKSIGC